jgi:hypothetical protein
VLRPEGCLLLRLSRSKRHTKTDNISCSVVPNLIEMLGTLLGRAGGGSGSGGGAGAVATTWMREILFAVSAVELLLSTCVVQWFGVSG